uniref:flagellin n=1 Tax=Pseudoalteromonas sp. 31A1 TaxID=2686351 RepID=UPI0013FD22AF
IGSNSNETINVSLSSVAADSIGSNQVNLQAADGSVGGFGAATTAAAATTTNGVGGGSLVIDGRGDASSTVTIAAGASAKDSAAAINQYTSNTGVTAQARTAAGVEFAVTTADHTVSFDLNDEKVSFGTSGVAADDLQSLAEAVNSGTDEHGVTATLENGELTFSNNLGEDIKIDDYQSAAADGTVSTTASLKMTAQSYDGTDHDTPISVLSGGLDSTTITGGIQLNSAETFTAQTAVTTMAASITAVTSTLTDIDSVDITNQKGSQDALAIIDNAIANIDSQRASLGAVQNRFDHTISNLANISENVSASRSRIQDTDFATETAEMTKNQILQQAGTSILSQANQLPQTALSLLG